MLYSSSTRRMLVIALSLLVVMSVIITAGAYQQSPQSQKPQPPQQPPQKQEQKDKSKKDQRQGAVSDEQQPAPGEDTLRIDTQLVQLDVTVIDQANNPIYDLKKDDFSVFEDKIKQSIENVSREEVPISLGMVIDTSGSMRTKLQVVSDAARGLIKQLRNEDEAFVAQFKAEPELVQDFTRDKRELEDAIDNLYTSGGTSLLDAIVATADYAHEKASKQGQHRRRALIVISDGLEKNSSVKEKEVIEAMKEDEVQVYFVGFVDEDEEQKGLFGRSPAKKAKELLMRLADDSGGRAFFPKDISEMGAIATQIAKDLRTQYVISYYPTNEKRDGSFRSVRVVVDSRDRRRLIARTRLGYYARPAGAAAQAAGDRKLTGKAPEH
ncbi:MAG TPA: VWA domain-containing protein [Blastocatellia bacterium]|nr:VWA domain-containing protein [Blastocatellia bacterium]